MELKRGLPAMSNLGALAISAETSWDSRMGGDEQMQGDREEEMRCIRTAAGISYSNFDFDSHFRQPTKHTDDVYLLINLDF